MQQKNNKNLPPLNIVLWALVLIGCLFALRSASNRYYVEKNNRRVEVAVDFAEVRGLASAEGVPLPEALAQFRSAGVTSVALQEETIGGLEDARRIAVEAEGDNVVRLRPAPGARADALLPVLESSLRAKTKHTVAMLSPTTLRVEQPWTQVRGLGIGLDPDEVAVVRKAGLGIVGRVSNPSGMTGKGIVWTLSQLKADDVGTVIFSGDEVLGFKGYVAPDSRYPEQGSTAQELERLGLGYGSVEFGKQKGDPLLAKAAPGQVVRVHTVTGGEMLTATVPDNIQRFALAARERNIRLLYVRLFTDEKDALKFNTDYLAKVIRALKRGGLETGTAHGYPPLGVGLLPRVAMGLGLAAALVLLVDTVTGFISVGGAGRAWPALAGLGALALAAAPVVPVSLGVKAAAFGAAVIFPTLALLYFDLLRPAGGGSYGTALGRFLRTCAITALGIAYIVGLLADRVFLIKVDAFIGIKAALVLPILITALVWALDLKAREGRSWPQALQEAVLRIRSLAERPILIWQIVAGAAVLVVLALIVARSGNESGFGVSGFELKLRSLLDRFLYARPRFKDMFGHAALVVALLMGLTRGGQWRVWAVPVLIAGAVGQVSLLNTFCHLHTPLPVSLWRALLGIGIGAIIGCIAYALFDRLVLQRLSTSAFAPASAGGGGRTDTIPARAPHH